MALLTDKVSMGPGHFRIIHQKDLPLGGFAGIVETRMLMSPSLWPEVANRSDISKGFGDFIYTAMGHFKPNDGAPMHPHRDVDIVTLVFSGEIGHEGSNGGGTVIPSPGVQVQRAGKGMTHSEFSTQAQKSDFVQLWFLPPKQGLVADYRNYDLSVDGGMKIVLGGDSADCFDSNMCCLIAYLADGEKVNASGSCIAIVFQGSGKVNDQAVAYGDLVEADSLEITGGDALGIILITVTDGTAVI